MTVAELSLNGINSIETFTTYTLWLSNFQQRHKKFDITHVKYQSGFECQESSNLKFGLIFTF